MIFLQVVSESIYFQWQIEVQITNFRKFGISDRMQILVWHPKGFDVSPWWILAQKYPEVKFFIYEDEGVDLTLYLPQLRPHTLKKHFKKYHEELKDQVFFYHDSDIIFNYLPDFQSLTEGHICWQSDTSHYLDYDYLYRKEQEGNLPEHLAISTLAAIGRVTVDSIKSYAGKTGGAQYVLKGIDSEFWEDVERQCLQIRRKFTHVRNGGKPESINTRFFKTEDDGFQSWCADMWAVNFALWNRGKVTDVTKELDFSWATDVAQTYHQRPIFHNAGATSDENGMFHKDKWRARSPIGHNLEGNPQLASYYYVQAINDVKI